MRKILQAKFRQVPSVTPADVLVYRKDVFGNWCFMTAEQSHEKSKAVMAGWDKGHPEWAPYKRRNLEELRRNQPAQPIVLTHSKRKRVQIDLAELGLA